MRVRTDDNGVVLRTCALMALKMRPIPKCLVRPTTQNQKLFASKLVLILINIFHNTLDNNIIIGIMSKQLLHTYQSSVVIVALNDRAFAIGNNQY